MTPKRTGLLPEVLPIDAATRREQALDRALKAGKIASSEVGAYRRKYDADPDKTDRLLSRLAPAPALVADKPPARTGLLPDLGA